MARVRTADIAAESRAGWFRDGSRLDRLVPTRSRRRRRSMSMRRGSGGATRLAAARQRICRSACCCACFAYRIQAAAYGGPGSRCEANARPACGRRGRKASILGDPAPSGRAGALKPGTVLVREWNETLHRVTVRADGFAWQAGTFASLSAVAEAITGTSWSGPRFFGTEGIRRQVRPSQSPQRIARKELRS